MRRAALSASLLLLAVLIQLTLFGNLRLPGGAGPDLVLVVVVALALTGGPMEGVLGGFCAGLALDVAPPATHLVGQYALVFCLVGYAAGRVGSHLDETAWVPIGVVAVGSAVGELLFALTGMIFGNLDVTWSAVGHVLPASVVYDVLLSPFVLYAVVRARALASPATAAKGLASFPGGSAGQLLGAPGLAAAAALFSGSGTVLRDSGTGRPPKLRARVLRAGSTHGGSASGTRPAPTRPSRPVHLKFGSGSGGSALSSGSAAAARAGRGLAARPVNLHLGSSRNRQNRARVTRPQGGGGMPAKAFSHNRGNRPGGTRSQGSWQRGGGIPASAFSRGGRVLGDGGGGRALRPSRGPRLRGRSMPGGSASGTRVGVRIGVRPTRPVRLRLGSGRRSDGAIGGSVLGRRARGAGPRAGKVHTPRFRGSKAGALSGRRTPARALNGRRAFGRRRSLWRIFGKRSGGLSR